MKKAVTSAEMKEIDRLAEEEYFMPSIILMENAGRASAEEILKKNKKGKAAVFCGKGNNGGDGFVCSRHLFKNGVKTDVFLLGRCGDIKNRDPLANLKILRKAGVPVKEITSPKDLERLRKNFPYDIIVDAIFGIGFKGKLPENIENIVKFINSAGKRVYSLDAPSGLDATSGKTQGACVKAYMTITFGLPKTGLLKRQARKYVGRLIVRDIGFPEELLRSF